MIPVILPPLLQCLLLPLLSLNLIKAFGIIIRQPHIINILAHLRPLIRDRRDREELAQQPVHARRNDEASKEVDVVDIHRWSRNVIPDGADKPDDVDEDTRNIRRVPAPVQTSGVVIRGRFSCGVEVSNLKITLANEVIVGDHDAGDGGEEDGVGGEVEDEVV